MNAVATLADVSSATPAPSDRRRRITEVVKNPVEDSLIVKRRGEQSLDILHDEHRGPVLRENLKILNVQTLTDILAGVVVGVALVPGSAGGRVGLAGGTSNEDPAGLIVEHLPDSAANFILGFTAGAEGGMPAQVRGTLSLRWVCFVERVKLDVPAKMLVVLLWCLSREQSEERPELKGSVSVGVLFDRQRHVKR